MNPTRDSRILVINVGSSSLKWSVTQLPAGIVLAKAEAAIGKGEVGPLVDSISESGIDAIGHRVVHGGEQFRAATRIDETMLSALEALSPLAPLHNPPALEGIRAARARWPGVPQVAVFDTAFHLEMPAHASTYAVPETWRAAGVRRYGFHGTSHKYVMEHVAATLGVAASGLRIISCHLGNGASICAIENGHSVDTSMGMTPLEGLVMGTRSGDIDPGIVAHVHRTLGLGIDEIEHALYHGSGLAGLSGLGKDAREIEAAAAKGVAQAQLALEVYAYRARKYIGAYAAAMGGVDVLAFTGGIGENSAAMRARICVRLEFLGIRLDPQANERLKLEGFELAAIHEESAATGVFVTQAREQWMIAQETARLLETEKLHG
ncbi:MAG: acetate/propionate family kinase [Usitatibacter sp.]